MAFIPSIVWGGINMSERCCSILSVLSLVTTAYIMKYIPLRHLGPNGKRPMQGLKFVAYVHKYAIPVNTAICGFLLFVYMLTAPMESSGNNQPAAYLVPGGRSSPF
ncbi:hypothetical protein BDV25DRAFT_66921 [Aspergillus avenaceus]|uniref:Uncharacterized protein n=1 Tax=Aspergillus avenaceus TaxID=36643 RepID=A0A5N6TH16_ASPAV|nr:hypothetical protein BDV25DRAFT_66921 [Aspergillus avenaceus]